MIHKIAFILIIFISCSITSTPVFAGCESWEAVADKVKNIWERSHPDEQVQSVEKNGESTTYEKVIPQVQMNDNEGKYTVEINVTFCSQRVIITSLKGGEKSIHYVTWNYRETNKHLEFSNFIITETKAMPFNR